MWVSAGSAKSCELSASLEVFKVGSGIAFAPWGLGVLAVFSKQQPPIKAGPTVAVAPEI